MSHGTYWVEIKCIKFHQFFLRNTHISFSIHSLLAVLTATILAQVNRTPVWTIMTPSQKASQQLQSFEGKAKVCTYQTGKRSCNLFPALLQSHTTMENRVQRLLLGTRGSLDSLYWVLHFSCSSWWASQSSQRELFSLSDLHHSQCLSLITPFAYPILSILFMST